MLREFLQKDQLFLKKVDSFKESKRTYSFDMFTLFVLTSFEFFGNIKNFNCYFLFRIRTTCLLFGFGLYLLLLCPLPIFFFTSLYCTCVAVLQKDRFFFKLGRRPNTPKSTWNRISFKNQYSVLWIHIVLRPVLHLSFCWRCRPVLTQEQTVRLSAGSPSTGKSVSLHQVQYILEP